MLGLKPRPINTIFHKAIFSYLISLKAKTKACLPSLSYVASLNKEEEEVQTRVKSLSYVQKDTAFLYSLFQQNGEEINIQTRTLPRTQHFPL